MDKKWRIAVVGCGLIANSNYLPEVKNMSNADIVAVCDIIPERAKRSAERFNIPRWYGHIDELLKDCEFEILLDLTSIDAHFEINLKALQAGKHLYSQKPIATTVKEARILIEEAKKRNLKISASPIHMLRPDIQEARRIIKEGIIGKVSFIRCSVSHGGPEYFQFRDVDPSWFYKPTAGPLLDLGVHGLHQVTGLLGPAKRVTCFSGISEKKRIVRTGAFDGKEIEPLVDDNTLMLLDFGEA
ncbi:Gfo/Idh/MocA family oxidoreductase, partial [bacterium]|nr:Gfo/Idh/MocA family oxidoreductase [bacterium]